MSWKFGKQPTVSWSSTEAEYHSVVDATAELNWIASMVKEMGIIIKTPLKLACDNLGANYLARNLVHHGKAKHVAISYHFVREQVSNGNLIVEHVRSENQQADILTKALPTLAFTHMRNNLNCDLLLSLRRGVSRS